MPDKEFTREDILRVAGGTPYDHPVIDVLRHHTNEMKRLSEYVAPLPTTQLRQRALLEGSEPLIQGIEQATPWEFNPLDMVATWREAMQFPYYRHMLARVIPFCWAIQGVENADLWRGSSWDYLGVPHGVPNRLFKDPSGIIYVQERLQTVNYRFDVLEQVNYGQEKDPIEGIREIMHSGNTNPTAQAELDRLLALIDRNRIPLLDDLGEALGNAIMSMNLDLSEGEIVI